jgi:hypothetical protein
MNSHVAVLKRIARGERPKATDVRPDLPREVDEVLGRAMAIDRKERYDSAAAFALALRSALLEEPVAGVDGPSTIVDGADGPTFIGEEERSAAPVPEIASPAFDELATESEGHEVPPAELEAHSATEGTRSDRPPRSEPAKADRTAAPDRASSSGSAAFGAGRKSPVGLLLMLALAAAIGVAILLAAR